VTGGLDDRAPQGGGSQLVGELLQVLCLLWVTGLNHGATVAVGVPSQLPKTGARRARESILGVPKLRVRSVSGGARNGGGALA